MSKSKPDTGCRNDGDAAEIVFTVDGGDDESAPERAIIADITRDDAWVMVAEADALELSEWR
ncbi:DUF7556 family protein [Halegenticoccus soli]|uniref:DUF7556 family protein n=1 Tax=Halegenticoccus soli TaxID=1985678 RepID=UPI000C6E9A37|nr:hypothetical protein [Halegenticoccus soli]